MRGRPTAFEREHVVAMVQYRGESRKTTNRDKDGASMIDRTSRPKRGERVLAKRAAQTVVLLNPDDGQYFTLDEVGARVWELCDGTRRVADVVSTIHEEYEAPVTTIEADVLALLADLGHEKLISQVP